MDAIRVSRILVCFLEGRSFWWQIVKGIPFSWFFLNSMPLGHVSLKVWLESSKQVISIAVWMNQRKVIFVKNTNKSSQSIVVIESCTCLKQKLLSKEFSEYWEVIEIVVPKYLFRVGESSWFHQHYKGILLVDLFSLFRARLI